jgi:putative Mn2+ efflux pump MntP
MIIVTAIVTSIAYLILTVTMLPYSLKIALTCISSGILTYSLITLFNKTTWHLNKKIKTIHAAYRAGKPEECLSEFNQ